ncbi:MAG: SPFH domain-containing protein [Epsilonproteobacteria bacterium]|nr:SPFH domain-containing protein [Campylobacterota bacterium]
MGFFDKLMGEFIDVIEWTDNTNDTMVYRFERYGNEIKNEAKLIVRESQVAVFVNEGEIADVFEAGIYELNTNNLPILTTLKHWDHGFNSPFKAEVYFFNTRRFTDLKWGTKNPIMLRDKEFGPVRIRSFGSYSISIQEPTTFLTEIVGTDGYFTIDEISEQLRNLIVSRFATIIGQMSIPILDLAANYEDVSDFIQNKITPEFSAYGLKLTKLLVENISLPPKVEEALDKRTSMGLAGNLDDYLKYQSAEALANAGNGSSTAGDAMGMGMGFAMASQMANSFNTQTSQPTPPPIPKAQTYYLAINGVSTGPLTIEQIKAMIQKNQISKETLAWREGMDGWEKISSLDKLKNLFKATPPPIPN